jgi:hypothetical protein
VDAGQATGVYRGLYEWDDVRGAVRYAERLRQVLTPGHLPRFGVLRGRGGHHPDPYVDDGCPVPTG